MNAISSNTSKTLGAGNLPDGNSDVIIQVEGLHKTYVSGDVQVQALRGVDLSVKRGEMVAIMGPSGCGKTTLLNSMSGLDTFDAGVVHIGGVNLASMNDKQKTAYRALNMGFIFQTYNLLPVLSAVENVELPLVVSGVDAAQGARPGDPGPRACGPGRPRAQPPIATVRRSAPTRHDCPRAR